MRGEGTGLLQGPASPVDPGRGQDAAGVELVSPAWTSLRRAGLPSNGHPKIGLLSPPPAPRAAKSREQSDLELKNRIDEVYLDFPAYGYRKLRRELERRGLVVNEKRIRRIRRKYGLLAMTMRRFIRTTDSRHNRKRYSCLLNAGMKVAGLKEVWVAGITYVRVEAGCPDEVVSTRYHFSL